MDGSEIILQKQASNTVYNTDSALKGWMYERVKSFVVGRALEIADGKGYIAPVCKERGSNVEVMSINLTDDEFDTNHINLFNGFDTVIALDESKRIVHNSTIVSNCAKLLKQNGNLLILLPAHTALYKGLDQGLQHWKFYNLEYLDLVMGNSYEIIKIRYVLIGGNHPPSHQEISKYQERVAEFSISNSHSFSQSGLLILVVCRKK